MRFTYKARTKDGKIETGTIEAYSKESAALLLQKYNIFVTSLEEQWSRGSFLKQINVSKKVSRKDLSAFFRQLAVMLESRVPVVQSLSSLAAQITKPFFKEVVIKVSHLVEEGMPLSEALAAHPKTFNNFAVNLVKSGEASGNISKSLYYIADYFERENDIISQVRQALVYPAFVICVLFVVIGVIITQVMPKISDLVKESNNKPSFFTKLMLDFYQFLNDYWWALLIIFLLLILCVFYYFRTKEGRDHFSVVSLKIPLVGMLLKKVFLTRFCDNISTLMTAGISINKALRITGDTVNNIAYKAIIADVEKGVSEGEKMSTVLVKYPDYFPAFVVQMIKVGEETGKLDSTLGEVVGFYQKEVKRTLDLLSSLIEPLMIIVLGIIVALIAVSVLQPLYGALETIG